MVELHFLLSVSENQTSPGILCWKIFLTLLFKKNILKNVIALEFDYFWVGQQLFEINGVNQ